MFSFFVVVAKSMINLLEDIIPPIIYDISRLYFIPFYMYTTVFLFNIKTQHLILSFTLPRKPLFFHANDLFILILTDVSDIICFVLRIMVLIPQIRPS